MSGVKTLSISGYKSIRDLKKLRLTNLNVLIGANGAGKSNFIGIFKLVNEIYQKRLQSYVARQGGPDALLHFGRKATERIHAEFFFDDNGYKFDLVPTLDNRLIFEKEQSWYGGTRWKANLHADLAINLDESLLKEASDSYSPYVREAVSSWRVYHFHDTSETCGIKGIQRLNDNIRLKPDASNIAPFLYRLRRSFPKRFENIVSTIRLVAPFFSDFVDRPDLDEKVELEWYHVDQPDTPLRAHFLSDGTLRFICLTTLLLSFSSASTILIDEPELGLHPYAISILADLLTQASKNYQIIVSTQSVELVNELSPADIIVVDQQDGASSFQRLEEAKLHAWLEDYSLGELWKKNIFGGRP